MYLFIIFLNISILFISINSNVIKLLLEKYICEIICIKQIRSKKVFYYLLCLVYYIISTAKSNNEKHEKVAELPNLLYNIYLIFCRIFFFRLIAHYEIVLVCRENEFSEFCFSTLLIYLYQI